MYKKTQEKEIALDGKTDVVSLTALIQLLFVSSFSSVRAYHTIQDASHTCSKVHLPQAFVEYPFWLQKTKFQSHREPLYIRFPRPFHMKVPGLKKKK